MTLAESFLAHAEPSVAAALAAEGDLEQLLLRRLDDARAAWPALTVSPADFMAHVARRLPAEKPLDALRSLYIADLYLAFACGRGDPHAIALFESHFMSAMPQVIARVARDGSGEDVVQTVRAKLLLRDETSSPKILDYSGQGPLAGWLRVSSVRTALNMMRGGRAEVRDAALDEAMLQIEAPNDSPEFLAIRTRHREDFKAAFEEAVHALPPERRNLLRMRFVDELTLDQLASLFNVHRATAARWLAEARDHVYEETRRALQRRLNLPQSEFESLIEALRSAIDLSIHRILAEADDPAST
jgi:RNA polymerase sigma-70 factor (ECF subfamily)